MSIKARPVKGTVRLNNNYNNVIRFKDNAEKFAYLEGIEEGFTYYLGQSPDINFNIGDTINTDITLDYSKYGDDLNSALNRNYLVVADSNFALGYYFYFIVGATPLNRGLVRYDLELDVFTTYTINKDYEIDDFLVGRAHQDRFTADSSAALATFNLGRTAPAQSPDEAETTFQSKYPLMKKQILFDSAICGTPSAVEPLNNIAGWMLVFISTSSSVPGTKLVTSDQGGDIVLPYKILVAPVGANMEIIREITTSEWSAEQLYDATFQGTSKHTVYGISVTKNCPIEPTYRLSPLGGILELLPTINYSNSKLSFDYFNYISSETNTTLSQVTGTDITGVDFILGMDYISGELLAKVSENINIGDLGMIIDFNDISKDDVRDEAKEPKFLKKTMTEIAIDNVNSEAYVSDAFDLGQDFNVVSLESVNLNSATSFTTFTCEDGYAKEFYSHNIGISSNALIDLPVVDDAYLSYIRSNKNAAITGAVIPALQTAASTVAQIGFGANPAKAIISGGINLAAGIANYHAEMDNLKSTPDTVKNFSNNLQFSMMKNNSIKDYLTVYTLKDNDRKMAYEYFYKYGYMVQERRNSQDLFGRYIFNYIQAMDSTADKVVTNVPMSNLIKNVIELTLQKGVTFWNYDSGKLFDYSYENYESRLFDTEVNND